MRFAEIANPEDQLALWKLVSDKMWAVLGPQVNQQPRPIPRQQLALSKANAPAKQYSIAPYKTPRNGKEAINKAYKPKKTSAIPVPKPLANPAPLQAPFNQSKKSQTQTQPQSGMQIAKHIYQALINKSPAQRSPQPLQPTASVATTVNPMNNSYSERERDELVLHRRENPFKPLNH